MAARTQRQDALLALETAGFTDQPMSLPRANSAGRTQDTSILAPCSITRRLSFGRRSSPAEHEVSSPGSDDEELQSIVNSSISLEEAHAQKLAVEDDVDEMDASQEQSSGMHVLVAAAELAAALATEELEQMRQERDQARTLARAAIERAEAAERALERMHEKEAAQTLVEEIARKRLAEDGMLRIQLGLRSAACGAA